MSSETANCCNIEGTRQGQKEGWSGNTHAISTPSMSTRDSSGCTPGSHVKMVPGWRGGDRGGAPGARAARPPGRPRPSGGGWAGRAPLSPLSARRKEGRREGGGRPEGGRGANPPPPRPRSQTDGARGQPGSPPAGARGRCAPPHLVLLLAPEAQARRPLLEALAVVGPRLVGLELHHRGGFWRPLLLQAPRRGPGRRHPAGEWGRGEAGAGVPGGEAAARGGQAAKPVGPGAGGRSDAGRGASAGHWSPGAAEEAPPVLRRPPLSMEPAARSLLLPPVAAAAKPSARLEGRTTRRQLRRRARTGRRRRRPRPCLSGPRMLRPARQRACARPAAGGGEGGSWEGPASPLLRRLRRRRSRRAREGRARCNAGGWEEAETPSSLFTSPAAFPGRTNAVPGERAPRPRLSCGREDGPEAPGGARAPRGPGGRAQNPPGKRGEKRRKARRGEDVG